jgi:hypothetical protein
VSGWRSPARSRPRGDRIAKLHELKTKERPKFVSADTAVTVAANLIGIYWLTTYERERPITSKVINFILKPRT